MPGETPLGDASGTPKRKERDMPPTRSRSVRPGDVVVVSGHRVGESKQVGEVLEVLGEDRSHYRVRWEDGHESVFFPGSDTLIRHPARRAASDRSAP
jgi:Domain of unknown function (DUF1918)